MQHYYEAEILVAPSFQKRELVIHNMYGKLCTCYFHRLILRNKRRMLNEV